MLSNSGWPGEAAQAFRARSLAALQPPHNAKTGRCGDPDTRGLRDDAFSGSWERAGGHPVASDFFEQ